VIEYDAIPEWAYNWPDYRGPYEGLVEKGLARTKSEMTLLAQELKKLGVPLTLVFYPWPQQVKKGDSTLSVREGVVTVGSRE
jgi:hypothetical protein